MQNYNIQNNHIVLIARIIFVHSESTKYIDVTTNWIKNKDIFVTCVNSIWYNNRDHILQVVN